MGPPEILDDFFYQFLLICHQFRIKKSAAFESILMEHPLTEAMNGEDGRFIEIPDGCMQTPHGNLLRNGVRAVFDQLLQEGVIAGSP